MLSPPSGGQARRTRPQIAALLEEKQARSLRFFHEEQPPYVHFLKNEMKYIV